MRKIQAYKVGIGGLILAALLMLWAGMAIATSNNSSSKFNSPKLKIKEFREAPPTKTPNSGGSSGSTM